MHQIAFGYRAPPGPAGGAYSAPQTRSWIKGSLLLREWDRKGVEGGEKRAREGKVERRGERGESRRESSGRGPLLWVLDTSVIREWKRVIRESYRRPGHSGTL